MLRSGFFNSQNHDRMYNATDFNELISTIKSDGIDNYGDKLEVSAGQDLSVLVSTGKCFFNNHWLYNDNAYQIELEEASIVAPRIDAIVVEVSDTERDVFLKSVSGEPSNNPVPPTLVDSGSVHQHLLAYVNVPKEATSVGTITDKRSEWSDVKSDKLDDVQDQITENIENGTTASRTYNAGEYIVRGGVYNRVKTTIASGTSFVVGTNIEETSVGDEISTINSEKVDKSKTADIVVDHTGKDIATLVYNLLIRLNFSKITPFSYAKIGNAIYRPTQLTDTKLLLIHVSISSGGFYSAALNCEAGNNRAYQVAGTIFTDISASQAQADLEFYY